ncbi:MAG: hypothetical protein KDN22_02960 [Verrucomicrobiae bacterium]|nr:hypothetical protein [Verrucomicrobiae bacterium]
MGNSRETWSEATTEEIGFMLDVGGRCGADLVESRVKWESRYLIVGLGELIQAHKNRTTSEQDSKASIEDEIQDCIDRFKADTSKHLLSAMRLQVTDEERALIESGEAAFAPALDLANKILRDVFRSNGMRPPASLSERPTHLINDDFSRWSGSSIER